jgi:beta-N-acetylhexosaminidase
VLALAAATLLLGHSVEHRPITAVRSGNGTRTVLVVGSVHGEEPGGHAVIRALRARRVPGAITLYTVRTANPDGLARGTRTNARGVDLNRNFAHAWRLSGRGRFYGGPKPFSEPESRALRKLILRVKPDVTVWLHQPYGIVVDTPGARKATLRAYAKRVGLPLRALPRYPGTAVGWQHAVRPDDEAFVVELPAGAVSAATARRHAAAILATARASAAAAAAARPTIVQSPIPFGTRRKRQMKAYARRHYGLNTHLLKQPRVIVEHFTASDSFSSAFNTFASNARDSELGELPGVCAHFVIEADGTIHQLVDLRYMCRHTVGLNHRAIGIEHVGTSDAQVMGRSRELAASLRLTRWLMGEYAIEKRDVIGHAESLSSRFHYERVARLRTQTHGDFAPAAMRRYRGKI